MSDRTDQLHTTPCAVCGAAFDHVRRDARYCSPACRHKARRRRARALRHGWDAYRTDVGWAVRDPTGGIWLPGSEAQVVIDDCDRPDLRAIDICINAPTQGTWQTEGGEGLGTLDR